MSIVYNILRGAGSISERTPQNVRHFVGSAMSAAIYYGWRSKRLVTQQNMAHVTGLPPHDPRVRRLAFISWWNYGRYVSDFLHFPYTDIGSIDSNLIDLTQGTSHWQDYVNQALEPGHGALFISSHFGNYDLGGAIMARYVKFFAIAETFSDAKLNALVQNQRMEKGVGIIPLENSARKILRVLRNNQIVAILVDRPATANDGVPVTFFGSKTYVPGGSATLALKTGAAIMPGYVWYGRHNQFFVRTFPPIFPRQGKDVDQASEVIRLTQYMMNTFEEMVREWPKQWYMFRAFWPQE